MLHTVFKSTLLGTNISHFKGTFEDDFPIPQVGYVNSLVGSLVLQSFFEFGIIVDRFGNELIGLEITKRQAPDKVPKSRGILVILGV